MASISLSKQTLEQFTLLLRERLEHSVFTTEDSVRYTFFAAMLNEGIRPHQMVQEYPHPNLPNKEVDTVIVGTDRRVDVAIEFKYDRQSPRNSASPRPMKAGAIFADLSRLIQFPEARRKYFVHLSDDVLVKYLKKPRNGLAFFYCAERGSTVRLDAGLFSGLTKTFRERMGPWPGPAAIRVLTAERLPDGHELRVYEIESDKRLS